MQWAISFYRYCFLAPVVEAVILSELSFLTMLSGQMYFNLMFIRLLTPRLFTIKLVRRNNTANQLTLTHNMKMAHTTIGMNIRVTTDY